MKRINRYMHKLLEIVITEFPLWLLLIAYSMVPGLFRPSDIGIIHLVSLLISAPAWATVMVVLAHLKRWLWWTVFCFTSLVFFSELVCFYHQSTRILSTVIAIVLQTTASEATEFIYTPTFKEIALRAFALTALCCLSFLLINRIWQTKHIAMRAINYLHTHRRSGIFSVSLFIAAISLSAILNVHIWVNCLDRWHKVQWNSNSRLAVSPLLYFHSISDILEQNKTIDLDILEKSILDIKISSSVPTDSLSIIYVIGESHNKHRTNLYGYFLPTSPNMQKLASDSSLIIFTDVIAYSKSTRECLPRLLSMQPANDPIPYSQWPLMPAIFKKAGVYVEYYDNQSLPRGKNFDFGCNYFMSRNTILKNTFSKTNTELFDFDNQLIDSYPPSSDHKQTLTIYHLMGQHVDPKERYPKSETKFTESDYMHIKVYDKKKRIAMAHYDNAILFQDKILMKLIDRIKDKNAILIYTPDHGETIYDSSMEYGRKLEKIDAVSLKSEIEIPLYIPQSGIQTP